MANGDNTTKNLAPISHTTLCKYQLGNCDIHAWAKDFGHERNKIAQNLLKSKSLSPKNLLFFRNQNS
jgi:hypothetical protein